MLRIIICLALFVGINAFYPVNHINCTYDDESEAPTGNSFSIEVSNCTDPDRCPLYRGTHHDIRYCFNCTEDSSTDVHMFVYGDFGPLSVKYGDPHSMCNTTYEWTNGTTCAETGGMLSDQRYCFVTEFKVLRWYPKLSLDVRFVAVDREKNRNLACVKVPVKITDLITS